MFRRKLPWMPVILWMLVIFYLSSQSADQSNQLSMGVTVRIYEAVNILLPELEVDVFNHMVRKYAHFFAYMILGILSVNALYLNGIKDRKAILYSFIISFLYAISDEIHQIFVPGRAGQVMDVLIDSSGGIIGIAIYASVYSLTIGKRRIH